MSAESIQVEVTRDARDYRSAIWLNYWHGGGWLWMVAMGLIGAVVSCLLAEPWESPVVEAAITAGLVLGAMFIAHAITILLTAAGAMKLPGAREPVRYAFSEESLGVSSNVGHGTTNWVNWRKAFENRRVIVVRHRVNLMHILPKRQLSAKQQEQIRALLRRVLAGRVAFMEQRT